MWDKNISSWDIVTHTHSMTVSVSSSHPLYIYMRSHARDCSVYNGLKCPYLQVLTPDTAYSLCWYSDCGEI